MKVSQGVCNGLPGHARLPVSALSRAFGSATNSYKYVFFLSLLDVFARGGFDARLPIQLECLAVEMLATAWYPHTYFKLSFGKQDQLAVMLDQAKIDIRPQHKDDIRARAATYAGKNELLRYVPFRFIRTFFDRELQGLRDSEVDSRVAELSNMCFDTYKPIYRIERDGIFIHSEWADYLKLNYAIVRDWACWNWLGYMQRRNPSTPAVANKLFPPARRETLTAQRSYWKIVANRVDLKCIYTGDKITTISLDHYLPWSFIVHDQLWNLLPTSPSVNSSKGDRLPADIYFEKFVELQHLGLKTSRKEMPHNRWQKAIEPYLSDLCIPNENELLDLDCLMERYAQTVRPLLTLAENQGFTPGWVCRKSVSC